MWTTSRSCYTFIGVPVVYFEYRADTFVPGSVLSNPMCEESISERGRRSFGFCISMSEHMYIPTLLVHRPLPLAVPSPFSTLNLNSLPYIARSHVNESVVLDFWTCKLGRFDIWHLTFDIWHLVHVSCWVFNASQGRGLPARKQITSMTRTTWLRFRSLPQFWRYVFDEHRQGVGTLLPTTTLQRSTMMVRFIFVPNRCL